jgi:hypothetical protein
MGRFTNSRKIFKREGQKGASKWNPFKPGMTRESPLQSKANQQPAEAMALVQSRDATVRDLKVVAALVLTVAVDTLMRIIGKRVWTRFSS